MALKNKSEISMIAGPEFINLQPLDINPLMSLCQIKVFYLGHNRNGSYINRATAEEMAKTLRGTPIVAAWNENKQDFGDHGEVIRIEDGEIHFECKTIPYGFVSPDAEVWFQNFIDTDEFDNQVERTYLMTTGYLWDGQFQELKKVLEEGQPHSMELDEKSLDGHWAKDNNLGVEFFIINDAVFSKLCILGDNVEPCFEGSSVTAISSEVEKVFSNNKNFSSTLFTMMNELTDALQSKGGLKMPDEFAEQTETVEEVESTENEFAAEVKETEIAEETVDYTDAEEAPETEAEVEFAESDDDKDDSEEAEAEFTAENKESEVEEEQPVSNFTDEEYEALKSENESLRAEVASLREFKLTVENEQKDALMDSFPYNTLSAEDKRDVIEHKSEYSLDEIKAKLAVIYIEKGVQFAAETEESSEQAEDEEAITTFSLDGEVAGFVSPLQEALRKTRQN
jgi:hypothetical protein